MTALRILMVGDATLAASLRIGFTADDSSVLSAVDSGAAALIVLGGHAAGRTDADAHADAVVVAFNRSTSAGELASIASRAALIVVAEADAHSEADALAWLRLGADDVILRDELAVAASCRRRILFAIERRRLRVAAAAQGHPHSTDLATGLPHRQQLVEHLSQLLALREREPAPMAVLALRIEPTTSGSARGSETGSGTGGDTGSDTAATLRRKAAVRLRAGLRASDIVAAIEDEAFVVLLGAVLSPTDAVHVASKVVASLLEPFTVGGVDHLFAVAVGIAHYPEDGRQADKLIRRALALAAVAPPVQQDGPATVRDPFRSLRSAANDDN